MADSQLRYAISALSACALALLALGHELLAAVLCGPPLLLVLLLDQRSHTAEAHEATASLRARAPQLTASERKAELDALTAQYGGKWTRDVRDTARELNVSAPKVTLGLDAMPGRDKRAFLIFGGFISVLVLFALVASTLGSPFR